MIDIEQARIHAQAALERGNEAIDSWERMKEPASPASATAFAAHNRSMRELAVDIPLLANNLLEALQEIELLQTSLAEENRVRR